MSRFTGDAQNFDGIRQALHQEIEAHAQTKAALAAATGRLEAVEELPGKWNEEATHLDHPAPFAQGAKTVKEQLAAQLTAALASTGPGLRERVEKALKDIRERADANMSTEFGDGLTDAADLVQAALDGEVT